MSDHFVQLASVKVAEGNEAPVVVDPDRGVALASDLLPGFDGDLQALLGQTSLTELATIADAAAPKLFRDIAGADFTAPYRHPRKIWGIGLTISSTPATCPRTCRPSRRRS